MREVWGQDLAGEAFGDQLASETSGIWVSLRGGEVVGFTSAFRTEDLQGHGRWEIDLVAVHPEHQGEGRGRLLVEAAYGAGVRLGLSRSRAFVRVDNTASQRMFEHAGFATDGVVRTLHLWDASSVDKQGDDCPAGVRLIPVDTLTYRGLWIEGLESEKLSGNDRRHAIRCARRRVGAESRLNMGAFLCEGQLPGLDGEERPEVLHGAYHCWTRAIG